MSPSSIVCPGSSQPDMSVPLLIWELEPLLFIQIFPLVNIYIFFFLLIKLMILWFSSSYITLLFLQISSHLAFSSSFQSVPQLIFWVCIYGLLSPPTLYSTDCVSDTMLLVGFFMGCMLYAAYLSFINYCAYFIKLFVSLFCSLHFRGIEITI